MEIIADLEVHSKYSRAVSPQMTIPIISEYAAKKGIDLVGTGDFTHPMWLKEIETNLTEAGEGVYRCKNSKSEPLFLLTSEISCIYSDKGKTRRVHVLVYLPDIQKVKSFNSELLKRNANLASDGRPIVGLSLKQIAQIALEVDSHALLIPAHVWTPWFGLYGSMSGYDSLSEAFGDLEKYIPAIETGLSSSPAMNWRIKELERRSIVSFSDAHSPARLGREATVFELDGVNYENIYDAVKNQKIAYTIEFYPEEGKYHFPGHRNCKIVYSPEDIKSKGNVCPVCGKSLTGGVVVRVDELGGAEIERVTERDKFGVKWIGDKKEKKPGYVMLVPLIEIISESLGVGVGSKKVNDIYELLINQLGSEFEVLLRTSVHEIKKVVGPEIGEGIEKVRCGDIVIEPGYDGVFGKVKIWGNKKEPSINQESLF